MKISKIKIKSYKTIKEIELYVNDITTLIVGKNNIGKSNVLKALELFFTNLNSNKSDAIINQEDYRFNTERVEIKITFDDIKAEISRIEDRIKLERSKRVNRDILNRYELLYLQFEAFQSKRNKLEVILEIKRKNNSKNFSINYSPTDVKLNKYSTTILKKDLFEKAFPQDYKKLINDKNEKWYFYRGLKVIENEEKYILSYKDLNSEIQKSSYKQPKSSVEIIKENILTYLSETQKFLYVPAYRGEKKERNEILDRLFDIIIEDLITTRGITKDYDTITDAIWGTGKYSNKQNLHSVISKRTESLIEKITKDSISTITGFEFERGNNKDIRKGILKLMIGNPSLYLNDGVKTSFSSKGTGIQSSFMITLMKALSEFEFINSSNILLVVEEPEAFTHPQLTREIMDLMIESKDSDTQFIIASHSPVVVNYVKARNITRLSEIQPKGKIKYTVNSIDYDTNYTAEDWNLIDRITDVMLSEIVFADYVLFVEGEGDKAILDIVLKEILPKEFHRLSVVSISGNYQIFKLLKLLKYFSIPWTLVADKDSFIEKTFEDQIEITDRNLDDFLTKYQISPEVKVHYQKVLENFLIDKIISKSAMSTGFKMGQLLRRIQDIKPNISAELKTELFNTVSNKISNAFIPDVEATEIANAFNDLLIKNEIPLYALESDLEGFIVNSETFEISYNIYRKYFEEKADNFDAETVNFTKEEKIRLLRECIGSKTAVLNRVRNRAKNVKKPHIPLEIIVTYLESQTEKRNLTEIFPSINSLVVFLKEKLTVTNNIYQASLPS